MPIPNRANALRKILVGCDLKRLRELNEIFKEAFKEALSDEREQIADSLIIGARVTFPATRGRVIYGSITEVMRTRCKVQERDRESGGVPLTGRIWRVPLTMLTIVNPDNPDRTAKP